MKQIAAVFYLTTLFFIAPSVAQQPGTLTETLQWSNTLHFIGEKKISLYDFKNCFYDETHSEATPLFYKKLSINNDGVRAKITNIVFQNTTENILWTNNVPSEFKVRQYVTYEQAVPYLNIEFIPAIKEGNSIQVIQKFDINLYQASPNTSQKLKKANNFKSSSVLASGDWFKFTIPSDGVYKITGNQLKNIGVDVSNVSAKTCKIFTVEGGPLNETVSITHTDDLGQIPVELFDVNGNDRMDGDDFIRFYAQGPDQWILENGQYVYNKNVLPLEAMML